MSQLDTPLASIRGFPARFAPKLKKLKIQTVKDLLWHFPFRYEDYSREYQIANLEPGQHATIRGTIEQIESGNAWRRRMSVVSADIADNTGVIRATWFNQPYIANNLRYGEEMNFAGKVSVSNEGELYLSHPSYERISGDDASHTGRLVPIYPETRGLTSRGIRFMVKPMLKSVSFSEWIPEEIREKNNLPELGEAIWSIHFPETIESAESARHRFSFENLFLLQIFNMMERKSLEKKPAPKIDSDIEWVRSVIGKLPFELTETQKRSLWEIVKDLNKEHPMNRLLQGDVGSGKTVVAILSALLASRAGYQSAIMAPTEILAKQHYETIINLFGWFSAEFKSPMGLITSKSARIYYEEGLESGIKKADFIEKVKKGEIKIIIGTHSLIQKSLKLQNPALIVIDEQHRFGVRQRATLLASDESVLKNNSSKINKKSGLLAPHLLSMSATPIPRTLMLTVHGDLDSSLITELPSGRKKIVTKIVKPQNRNKAYEFIKKKIREGRQAFVVCPRIESTENPKQKTENRRPSVWADVKSVKEEYEKLSNKIFPALKVEMLHGKMKVKEKSDIMKDFRDGKTDILVSTSVIEVGVDVPNAVIMMVEGADRFGLAQLYQLRGRVGRDKHQSYCFLFTNSNSESTAKRLSAIERAKNGFELAEEDLKLRGPGQFLGEEQSGFPDIAMQGLQDPTLVKATRDAASLLLEIDPNLTKNKKLGEKIKEFAEQIHGE